MWALVATMAAGWACRRVVEGEQDAFPIAAAVRQAAPNDRVFVVWDQLDKRQDPIVDQAFVSALQCSDGDGCASRAIRPPEPLGDPLPWGNPLQPAAALHRDGAARLTVLLRQKVEPDCDGDGLTGDDGDPDDQGAVDLRAFEWDLAGGAGAPADVSVNSGVCASRGVAQVRMSRGVARACFTHTDPGEDDRVDCADAIGAGWAPAAGPTNDGQGDEDHLSMDAVGGERVVAAHQGRIGAVDAVRVHFPDRPGEPVVEFPSAGPADQPADGAQHPDLTAGGRTLRLVWQDGVGTTAKIWTAACPRAADCALPASWTAPEEVSAPGYQEDAELPQLAADGDAQWAVWTYDADPGPEVAARVASAHRCGSGPWSVQEVRAPDLATDDQSLEMGRPSLVLNRDEHLAHLALVEFDEFTRRDDLGGRTHHADLYWCTTPYDPCP
ncbi:MAG: hypothetical protein ABMA64_02015 [Myxococcota bacterium]